MGAFVGRKDELEELNRVYGMGRRVCLVTGDLRIGTTALVSRFCEGKECLTVQIPEGSPAEIAESIPEAVRACTRENVTPAGSLADAFALLSQYLGGKKVFVIDGIANAEVGEFTTELGKFAKKAAEKGNMLILCGGPAHLAEPVAKAAVNDIHVIRVGDLSLSEAYGLHPKMSPLDSCMVYMTVGGVPVYNALMNKGGYKASVEKCFLGQFPRLCSEAENLVRRSSVPYGYCSAILFDIAKGTGRPIDIADSEGISRQLCDLYMKKMEAEGLIARINPMGNAPKKPVYIVSKPLLAFYHGVVRNNPGIVYTADPDYRSISAEAGMFLELRFRLLCDEYLRKVLKCTETGGWWAPGEDTSRITLVGTDGSSNFVCACKFRSGKIDAGALEMLSERADTMRGLKDKKLVMFSISGFDSDLVKKAKKEDVLLIGPKELLG